MDRSTQHSDQRHAVITVAICFLIAVIEGLDIQAAGIAAAGIREHWFRQLAAWGIF
jgi:AAHS family 3-hydroxyphenylpropionic acid transporter